MPCVECVLPLVTCYRLEGTETSLNQREKSKIEGMEKFHIYEEISVAEGSSSSKESSNQVYKGRERATIQVRSFWFDLTTIGLSIVPISCVFVAIRLFPLHFCAPIYHILYAPFLFLFNTFLDFEIASFPP